MTSGKLLRDVLPREFFAEFSDTPVAKLLDIEVAAEYDGCVTRWPGSAKNVLNWWKLVDGRAVGWNENVSRGWSFPVHGRKS